LLEKVIEKFEASPSLGTIPNSQEAVELKKKWMVSKQQTNAANALKKQPENAFNRMNSINYGAIAQRSPSIIASGGVAGGSSSNNNLSPGDESTSNNNVSNNRRSSHNNSGEAGTTSRRNADKRANNMF
jgi:predicted NodU family carbamoyl transferase